MEKRTSFDEIIEFGLPRSLANQMDEQAAQLCGLEIRAVWRVFTTDGSVLGQVTGDTPELAKSNAKIKWPNAKIATIERIS